MLFVYYIIFVCYTHVIISTKFQFKLAWRLTKGIAEMKCQFERMIGVAVQSWL